MSVDVWKFAQDNVLLIAVAVASGGMLLWPSLRGGGGGTSVSTLDATLMINQQDGVVIDVRDADDYAKGHIVNARNIPAAEIESRLRELEKLKRRPLIVCCERGNRSAGAAGLLRKNGFEKTFSLGLDAWRQAGLPLEKS